MGIMKTDAKEIKLQVWEEIIGDCAKFEVKKDQVARWPVPKLVLNGFYSSSAFLGSI